MNTTIVISPRERFSSIVDSLGSLFATISFDVPVIVVEGGSPRDVRGDLEELQNRRPFLWVRLPYLVSPQEARNIGLDLVRTEYVVFADNDIHYEPQWLEMLRRNADDNDADLVAPLICIGPPANRTVHHAGGRLVVEGSATQPRVTEKHRLMNQPVDRVNSESAPVDNEIVEFHCFLARTDFVRRVGCMDERLVTREQIDFGLRALLLGARVTFEAGARVTYMAKVEFEESDLRYVSFRWSDGRARASLSAFTSTWGITTDQERVLNAWIQPHRMRAYASVFPAERAKLGHVAFKKIHLDFCEERFEREAEASRAHLPGPRFPAPPDPRAVRSMFEKRLAAENSGSVSGFPAILHGRRLVVAGMATMPSRRSTFDTALMSILPQVDRLYLFLDRFDRSPRVRHPKIVALDSQTFGDLRANGKFLGLLYNREDVYYSSVDDDIEYPQDYIETMLGHVQRKHGNALFAVHGSVLHDEVDSYRNSRRVTHRKDPLDRVVPVHVPSSCSSVFDTRSLWFDARKWSDINMVDLNLALECRRSETETWLVPRKAFWLQPLDECQPDSIYVGLRSDDRRQTELARQLQQALTTPAEENGRPVDSQRG